MRLRSFNRSQIDFLRTLRDAGAITPDTALTIEKDTIAPKDLEALVETGAISRVAPYRYFFRTTSRHAKLLAALDSPGDLEAMESADLTERSPAQLLKMVIFWIIVILVPLVLIQIL